jgi:hypothetical protein
LESQPFECENTILAEDTTVSSQWNDTLLLVDVMVKALGLLGEVVAAHYDRELLSNGDSAGSGIDLESDARHYVRVDLMLLRVAGIAMVIVVFVSMFVVVERRVW